MLRLVIGGFDPVVEIAKRHGHMGKAGDDIPMQIDGVQFDMGKRVQQRDAARGRSGAAARVSSKIVAA